MIVATPIDNLTIGGDNPRHNKEDVGTIDDLSISPMDAAATNNELLFVAAVVKSTKAQPLDD